MTVQPQKEPGERAATRASASPTLPARPPSEDTRITPCQASQQLKGRVPNLPGRDLGFEAWFQRWRDYVLPDDRPHLEERKAALWMAYEQGVRDALELSERERTYDD